MSAETSIVAGASVLTLAGRQVHLDLRPGSGPTVLLLGGCGVPSYVWDAVAERLPDRALVRLDRPGLLNTPWPGTLPQLHEEVATLAALARRTNGPLVVVAHSMAGFHAEALVRQHPGAVAALLLLDGSVEWRPEPPRGMRSWLQTARATRRAMTFAPLSRVGPLVERVVVSAQSRRRTMLDPVSPLSRDTYRRPDAVASVIAEQAAYATQAVDLAKLRETLPWPGTPTVVLTAAGDGGGSGVADQRRLAELLGARQHVIEDSRHLVMIDRPDMVAEQIRAFVDVGDDVFLDVGDGAFVDVGDDVFLDAKDDDHD